MSDLREELGRLADEVGEPVTFRELEATRRRRDRHRRTEALIVGIAVIVLATLFLAAALREPPPTAPGGHTVPSSPPSAAGASSGAALPTISGLCDQRMGPPLIVMERKSDGPIRYYLSGCPIWPAGKAFSITFETSPGHAASLQLFKASDCALGRCLGDPVWSGVVSDQAAWTYRLPALDPGQYALVDPHRARMPIVVRPVTGLQALSR